MKFCENCGEFIEYRRVNQRNIPIHKCPPPPSYRSKMISTPFLASAFLEPCVVCGREVLLLVSSRGRKAFFNDVSWPLAPHLHGPGREVATTHVTLEPKRWPSQNFSVRKTADIQSVLRVWFEAENCTECIEIKDATIDSKNMLLSDWDDSPIITVDKANRGNARIMWFSYTLKAMQVIECVHKYTAQKSNNSNQKVI